MNAQFASMVKPRLNSRLGSKHISNTKSITLLVGICPLAMLTERRGVVLPKCFADTGGSNEHFERTVDCC